MHLATWALARATNYELASILAPKKNPVQRELRRSLGLSDSWWILPISACEGHKSDTCRYSCVSLYTCACFPLSFHELIASKVGSLSKRTDSAWKYSKKSSARSMSSSRIITWITAQTHTHTHTSMYKFSVRRAIDVSKWIICHIVREDDALSRTSCPEQICSELLFYNTRGFLPFVSSELLAQGCSCIALGLSHKSKLVLWSVRDRRPVHNSTSYEFLFPSFSPQTGFIIQLELACS